MDLGNEVLSQECKLQPARLPGQVQEVMSDEWNRCDWRQRWSSTSSTRLCLGSTAHTHPLDVSIPQWPQSPHTVLCIYLETTPLWKEIRQVQISMQFLTSPPGWKWIKLYKWTNLPGLRDMAGGGIRSCQLLLSHLGRKPSSEVLCVALWSLELLSHLSCQEQLNSSTILLTLCKRKYILPKADLQSQDISAFLWIWKFCCLVTLSTLSTWAVWFVALEENHYYVSSTQQQQL